MILLQFSELYVQKIKKSISENRFLSYNGYDASFHVSSFTLPQVNHVISE